MSAPKYDAARAAAALTERHVARLRALCDAERAARLTQWGTASPGCLLAHTTTVAMGREPATGSAQATALTHRTTCAEALDLAVGGHAQTVAPNAAGRESAR